METVLPLDYEKITPDNRETLRFAARMKNNSGFIFMTNFQDHDTARIDQVGLQFKLNLKSESIMIPANKTFTLKKDESVILPFNLNMNGALLKYATAQLLTKIDDNGKPHYFFFAPNGIEPEFVFDKATLKSGKSVVTPVAGYKSTFSVTAKSGEKILITTLTREQALQTAKVDGHILITDATVLPEKGKCTLLNLGKNKFDYVLYPSAKGWKQQTIEVPAVNPVFKVDKAGSRRMTVTVEPNNNKHVQEYFLQINYVGDVAMAFINNSMVLDHFYYGAPWTIGLKRFENRMAEKGMDFYFRPLMKDAPYLKDLPQSALRDWNNKKSVLSIDSVNVLPEYRTQLIF